MRPQAAVGAGSAGAAGRIEPAESEVALDRILFGPRPVDRVLVASIGVIAVAIGCLLAGGVVQTDGGAFAVVLSPPVWLLALVPAPVLQFGLALARRRSWPAQDAYLRARLVATDTVEPQAMELRVALGASLDAAVSGGDCLAPLVAAGQKAGRLRAGYTRRLLMTRFRSVVAAFLGGVWILLAIVIGMAVAGGVVWL